MAQGILCRICRVEYPDNRKYCDCGRVLGVNVKKEEIPSEFLNNMKNVKHHKQMNDVVLRDSDIIQEILYENELFDEYEEVISRNNTVFDGENLISLDLSDLGLEKIPKDLFINLKSLKFIDLSNNKVDDLPYQFFEKDDMDYDLSGNPLHILQNNPQELKKYLERDIQRQDRLQKRRITNNKDAINYHSNQADGMTCNSCNRHSTHVKLHPEIIDRMGFNKDEVRIVKCINCNRLEFFKI